MPYSNRGDNINIKDEFCNTWETYESLFECLRTDHTFFEIPQPLRHPLIFYYGHTASFFMNKLYLSGCIDKRVNLIPIGRLARPSEIAISCFNICSENNTFQTLSNVTIAGGE